MTHKIRIVGLDSRRICLLCQQTSPKRWFGNMNMTSNCDVTKSAHQIQMTTICHWMKTPHENFLRTPLKVEHHFTHERRARTGRGSQTMFHEYCWHLIDKMSWLQNCGAGRGCKHFYSGLEPAKFAPQVSMWCGYLQWSIYTKWRPCHVEMCALSKRLNLRYSHNFYER